MKEEAVDRTMWRNRFEGGFEPVVRQNTESMNNVLYTRGAHNSAGEPHPSSLKLPVKIIS